MRNLKNFLKNYQYQDMIFDYINLCAIVDSGLASLVVAPTGAGKSALIDGIRIRYEKGDYSVNILARVSPMRLLTIQNDINDKDAIMLSDDFSTIGENEEMTYNTLLMMSILSYGHKYNDPLWKSKQYPNGLDVHVKSLAFLCGTQPLWLSLYTEKEVWETLVQEKILRYYRLPVTTVKTMCSRPDLLAQYLADAEINKGGEYPIKPQWINILANGLEVQSGNRGREYALKIIKALTRYIPETVMNDWIAYLSMRFKFEEHMIHEYYTNAIAKQKTRNVQHKEYMILFYSLMFNPVDTKRLSTLCKIRGETPEKTRQYIGLLVRMAQDIGWVYALRRPQNVLVIPTPEYQRLSLHNWRMNLTEKSKKVAVEEDNMRVYEQ